MKKYLLLTCLLMCFNFVGCKGNTNNKDTNNSKFIYNIVEKPIENITPQEIEMNNKNDILNVSRGYIDAWNKINDNFMETVLDDTVNNMKKEDFIKSYKKDFSKIYKKKFIESLTLTDYTNDKSIVHIKCMNKKSNIFSDYEETNETVIISLLNKDSKWVITNIEMIEDIL